MIGKLKEDFKNTSYRIYVIFLLCIVLSVLITACASSVGPSKRFVETSHEISKELFPVVINLIEKSNSEVLQDSIREEDREAMKNASQNGIEIYKMGLIRKFKNWRFDIEKQYEILRGHQKKVEKE
ncbi:hypothetical protein [Candidatus Uabimicrobium sp. HlEnr_7]|uniref:hypothetical protein n=1 Tax=Candidatus Uabimicrobium helgolandensis TaxID=3095367 RepID=UPI003558D771